VSRKPSTGFCGRTGASSAGATFSCIVGKFLSTERFNAQRYTRTLNEISADAVRAQLERILASAGFVDAGRLGPLLKVLVNSALTHETRTRTESDSELEQLRSRLEEYYASAGKDDPVVIELPHDAYVPVFRSRPAAVGYQPSPGRKLFMFVLCLAALISVWVFYWLSAK
jgi:hypothetical protein